ncbi:MAG: 4Fe-4S dicluster domain-containing protein [Nitrospirota bacterium]|nr:4Fe-4S dicluster domain-containing protein [Nitrospirota bacterium]
MQYAMVIDLQKCVGCGSCALACKTENNTQTKERGQTFNWADFIYSMEGKFPDVRYSAMPVLCNHCDEPKCKDRCPEPKALYKTEDGITMYNNKYCIQCKKCQEDCPYSVLDVDKENVQYSVISFNEVGKATHDLYKSGTELIKGGTSSPAGIAKAVKATPPYKHEYEFRDEKKPRDSKESKGKGQVRDVRADGWIDKCHFCIHRVRRGEDPYCVVSCPARARIFGDADDPRSEVSQLIKKYKPLQLKNNKGELLKQRDEKDSTKPNVYYIRSFKAEAKSA